MMGWYDNGWSWGAAGGLGMILMAAFWIGIVALAVWGIARVTRTQPVNAPQAEPPRAILDRRFASGEIDAEAYAQARRVLEAPSNSGR